MKRTEALSSQLTQSSLTNFTLVDGAHICSAGWLWVLSGLTYSFWNLRGKGLLQGMMKRHTLLCSPQCSRGWEWIRRPWENAALPDPGSPAHCRSALAVSKCRAVPLHQEWLVPRALSHSLVSAGWHLTAFYPGHAHYILFLLNSPTIITYLWCSTWYFNMHIHCGKTKPGSLPNPSLHILLYSAAQPDDQWMVKQQ